MEKRRGELEVEKVGRFNNNIIFQVSVVTEPIFRISL